MPYLTEEDRETVWDRQADCWTSGDLNYAVSTLVDAFLGDRLRYERINAAIGALEAAKLELYRRVAAPYEDCKCQQNGDVYRPRHPSSGMSCQPTSGGRSSSLARLSTGSTARRMGHGPPPSAWD